MAGNTTSTNMGLTLPTVYSDDGAWGGDLNTSLTTLDTHDHSPGKGVKIPSAGLNINADVSWGNFKLQNVSRFDFTDIISLQTGNNLVYVKGGNLYYNDGGGNQIAITTGGSVAGASGNITGLTGSNTVVFTPSNGTLSFNYLGVSATMILQASEYQAASQYSFGVGTPPGANFLSFASSTFNFNLSNKVLGIALSGANASTKTTLAVSQTVNRILTLPDATDTLVGKATADTLTNKTIVVANNTFTFRQPTVQTFLSGSGTYTTPANVLYLKVRAVGGGGGGGGSGTSSGSAATAGGNTTFGSSLLAANGGAAAVSGAGRGAAGGTASLGTGPLGVAVSGGSGGGSAFSSISTVALTGGIGGNSALGGAGGSSDDSTAGGPAATNSGSGGGGAGTNAVSNSTAGDGGGAGGFVDAIITSPAGSYSYAVGAGGSGGGAGTSGAAGGAGAAGQIIVEEHYQ